MDKRLFKSLTTAKARYENQIAETEAKLHIVNAMLETMSAPKEEAALASTEPPEGEVFTESSTAATKPVAFMESAKKKLAGSA